MNCGELRGGVKPVIRYHDYLALTLGLDAEWTRIPALKSGHGEQFLLKKFRSAFNKIDHIASDLKREHLGADLSASTYKLEDGNTSNDSCGDETNIDELLYRPVHCLPIGHADMLTMLLLDDFEPIHQLTARCHTTVEEIGVSLCPDTHRLIEDMGHNPNASGWKSIVSPAKMLRISLEKGEFDPPLTMLTRLKLNGWGTLGTGLVFEASLLRVICRRIVETLKKLEDGINGKTDEGDCSKSQFAALEIEAEDIHKTLFCLLDAQGQEEFAVWIKTPNFSIAMSVMARIHAITIGDVLAEAEKLPGCNENFTVGESIEKSDWFKDVSAFTKEINKIDSKLNDSEESSSQQSAKLNSISDLEYNHVFRWTRTTPGVSIDAYADPRKHQVKGWVDAVSILQSSTGHQHSVDQRLANVYADIIEKNKSKSNEEINNVSFSLHAMGQGDILLHHKGFLSNTSDLLMPVGLFFNQVRQTMGSFLEPITKNGKEKSEPWRRDMVGLSSLIGVPVPRMKVDGAEYFCPPVDPRHGAQLESLLPTLRWRIAPDDRLKDTDLREVQKIMGKEPMTYSRCKAHCGLSIKALGRSMKSCGLPDSVIHALEFLYQNYATLLGNPFVFDAVLDLYDAFATLHRIICDNLQPKDKEVLFAEDDLIDLPSLAQQLKQSDRKFDRWVAENLSDTTKDALNAYVKDHTDVGNLQNVLLEDFNNLIRRSSIYEESIFESVDLREETKDRLILNALDSNSELLNRMLIEDAYPLDLAKIENVRRLFVGKVNEIARFVDTLRQALEHRLYRAYPEEHHRDMDVDFRGGLNELLFAADAVQKCAIGVLRNCVLRDCGNRRDIIGMVMSIGFRPGISAIKINLEPELTAKERTKVNVQPARLAILEADVPHLHHVPSYLDFLHEAFHFIYDELRNPTSLNQNFAENDVQEGNSHKQYDILPTVPDSCVLNEKLGELFVHFLLTLFTFRDKPQLLSDYLLLQYRTSAWPGSVEIDWEIRQFVELATSAFLAEKAITKAKDWIIHEILNKEIESLLEREMESLFEVESTLFKEFQDSLTSRKEIIASWGKFWGNNKKGADGRPIASSAWECTEKIFNDYVRATIIYTPRLLGAALKVYNSFWTNEDYWSHGTDDLGASPWKIVENDLDQYIREHSPTGAPLPVFTWQHLMESKDFFMPIVRYLRYITENRLERLKSGGFSLRYGSSALKCTNSASRRLRLRSQICAIKTFWDISTALRVKRLGEMVKRNMEN